MTSQFFLLVLVILALLATLTLADPQLGVMGGLKEGADDILSTAGVHNQ